MMLDKHYADFAWDQTAALLAVDSPSGFTARAAEGRELCGRSLQGIRF